MVTVHGAEKAIVEELDRADLALAARFGYKVFHQGLDWVALIWEGAKRDYYVEVASDSGLSQTVLRGTVHRPFVNVPAPSRGSLFWRVLDADGKTTLGRGSASFSGEAQNHDSASELVSESSVPMLVVRSPRNGELVKGNRIASSGMAPVGSRVLVNGKPAPLDEKNRFEISVAPVGRPPLAIFQMLRADEPDVIIVRILRRPK